ncbi:uncharacterized protein LOC125682069 isoform X2 [Ostrea edulis]|uniref:uncharacterized protein LOC125682069 isoform X2 n=1 Tax=Ostrea edulis TaxID=37623 RepID=UPI0024AFC316|nr:uncharacterized protein LOC125682069 isoform X2 [Ostrea edulis]
MLTNCDGILGDPWEPDKTWFTSSIPTTEIIKNQPKIPSFAANTVTPLNKPQEYAKILNLMREVRKSLMKNHEKKIIVKLKQKKKEKPIVKVLSHRKNDVTVEVSHTPRQDEHQKMLDKMHEIMSDGRWKIQLKPKEARPGKHGLKKVSFHYDQGPKPVIDIKPTATITDDDYIANVQNKIEKQILSSQISPQHDDNLSNLSLLVDKLKALANNVSTTPKSILSTTSKIRKMRIRDIPRDLLEDQAMWIGMVTGCGLAAFFFVLCYIIVMLYRAFKRKQNGSNTVLDLNFNCPPDNYKDRQYSTLSQVHDPKTGRKYVVLMDDSKNYSITSSDSSSEEEIYNASYHSPVKKSGHHHSSRGSMNRTSTPIKTPLRLTRSAPGSPSVRRNLSRSWSSPPESPLARITPVFASPIKLTEK